MADHRKISQTLEKLLNSKTFAKPGIYRDLLNYLVNCSLKGEIPKEQQIALEVFGKKMDQDKEHNVRVYILHLRNKLAEYYQNEGKDDSVILEIPKGKYQVEFRFQTYKSVKHSLEKYSLPLFIAGCLICIFAVALVLNRDKFNQPKQAIWKGFLKPDYPILIVLGDHYFFSDSIGTGKRGLSRDTRINSDEELDAFLKEHPESLGKIRKSKTTYINKQAPIGLFRLMKMFGGGVASVEMKYSSQLKWEDTRNKHVIFIGSIKTLQFLKPTLEKAGLKYDLEHSSFKYQTADSTLFFDNRSENYLNREYSSLIHFCTNDKRKILFLLSDDDLGNIAAMKYLTDEKNSNFPERFRDLNYKAVFEVKGRESTDFVVNLVRIDPIRENISEIWP
jgi:Transcriptional regulatory protein, C terminal.